MIEHTHPFAGGCKVFRFTLTQTLKTTRIRLVTAIFALIFFAGGMALNIILALAQGPSPIQNLYVVNTSDLEGSFEELQESRRFADIQVREDSRNRQELMEALTKEQARIRAENGLPQRDRFCDILMDYLKRGVMPFADNDKNYPYHEPEEPQTKEQLWAKLVEQNKKLSPDDPDARRKLYNHCCMFGTARDAVDLFEEIQGVPMADSSYRDAIARYLYLGEREKALQTAERLATARLWAVAGPTQVRPMSFFEDPNLREFLLEPESLRRIREAAFIDDGSLIRK